MFKQIFKRVLPFTFIATASMTQASVKPSVLEGTWSLSSYDVQSQADMKMIPAMGKTPSGRVIFTPNHKIDFVLTGSDRKAAHSDADKTALLNSLVAYTGTWTEKDGEWCTHVETAWNPEWNGTEQCRKFEVDGNSIHVFTPWRQMPNWPGITRSIITFHRD